MAVDDPLLGHGRQVIVREDWLRLTEEPILEPGLPIIDPHHHLWQRGRDSYLLPELLADTASGHDIRGTIFVQCGEMYRAGGPGEEQSLGETEFVTGVAAVSASGRHGPTRACAGIIGMVDLTLGERSTCCSKRTAPSPAPASAAFATAPPGIPRRR
jgi:L-fuconolactonase